MHGPDGTDYENTTQYLEVIPRQRMVYDHGGHKDRPPLFRVTALFTEREGRTQLDMSMAFGDTEVAAEMRGFIRKAGGEGTWDRLAEYLGKRCEGKDQFFITRSFEAGIERVYDMWTEPAHLAQWLPPTGATMRFLRAEPRVGGSSFYAMTMPGGATMHGLVKYLALEKPHRVIYTQQFCDEREQVIRPPFFAHWPLAMLTTITLASGARTARGSRCAGSRRTRPMRHGGIPQAARRHEPGLDRQLRQAGGGAEPGRCMMRDASD
jgi:uncharacterized protein YndB with AHSA1/START domain